MALADIDEAVAALIVCDGQGQYFAIGWSDLERHRVPAGWVPAVAAVVAGAEPADVQGELPGDDEAAAPAADHALLVEAANPDGFRFASQRLPVWLLLR